MESAQLYVHDMVRLVIWNHAGNLAKELDLAVDDQPLPKPYLGAAISNQVAAFLALAEGPKPDGTISLAFKNQAGQAIFRADKVRTRPLTELREGLADPDACDRLINRVLRHAPQKLAGWTDQLTAVVADMRRTADRSRAGRKRPARYPTGAVERIEDGRIIGWAIDPRRPFQSLNIDVHHAGRKIATVPANRYRPDLKTDRAASGHHGFEFELDPTLADGKQFIEFFYAGSTIQLTGSPCRVVAGELVKEAPAEELHGGLSPPDCRSESRAEPNGISIRAAIDFVDGRRVAGWALDPSRPSRALRLQFEVNGVIAGLAVANELREDLECADGEFHHGFHVLLRRQAFASAWRERHRLSVRDLDSGRLLIDGYPLRYRPGQDEREIESFARRIDRVEQTLLELREQVTHLRRRAAYSIEDYDLWFREVHEPGLRHQAVAADESGSGLRVPRIGVIVPLTAECTLGEFQRVLDSLAAQAQSAHRFLVINRSQNDQAFKLLARSYLARIPALSWSDLRENSTPAFLNSVLRLPEAEFLLLLESGESLSLDALTWLGLDIARGAAKVVYADSDCIREDGVHSDPELRPDYNPDLLLSTAYIGSFAVQRELLESLAGELADEPEGVWQYDLLLRVAEWIEPREWSHIARVLTHRVRPGTGAPGDEPALARALSALCAHLQRSGASAEANIDDALYHANPDVSRLPRSFAARLRWKVPEPAPRVSIIIPTRDGSDLVRTCLESIQERTEYPNYEILLVDHESTEPEAQQYFSLLDRQANVQVLRYTGSFNWSAINNFAASHASGEVLCFLNNDTEVLSPDWLQEMVGHACRPAVGAVGAALLFRDGTLQHGGVVLGAHGIAEHAFTGLTADKAGYMMRARLTQNLSAVTGACLVCRREAFEAVGGFEIANLGVAFNDVDFCLRLAEVGYRNVWTPHALLYHESSRTRGRDGTGRNRVRLDQETDYMRKRWKRQLERDPCYNPAFERYHEPYAVLSSAAYSPLREVCTSEGASTKLDS